MVHGPIVCVNRAADSLRKYIDFTSAPEEEYAVGDEPAIAAAGGWTMNWAGLPQGEVSDGIGAAENVDNWVDHSADFSVQLRHEINQRLPIRLCASSAARKVRDYRLLCASSAAL